jgi:transcriptional regulator with XRE-family HTH domain
MSAGFHRVPDLPAPTAAAFGLAVREERESQDWSQGQLADRAGLSPHYISEIERGRRNPSLSVQASIADALGTPLSELVARAERR